MVLPMGAVEQHGPILPIDTDLRIAALLAEKLEEVLGTHRVLRLPPIPFTLSWEHRGFPGVISLSVVTLHHILDDLMTSLRAWGSYGPSLVVLVSWHGGNQALESLAAELGARHNLPLVVLPSSKSRRAAYQMAGPQDVHAGSLETSIITAFWPDLLANRTAMLQEDAPPFQAMDVQTALQGLGMRRISSSGVWGNAANPSVDAGKAGIQQLVAQMAAEVREMLSFEHRNDA
ncbi:Creatininase [Kyrpidia tusciae DSM 2912]|uniref:Creatininase n=1 Tax=Kyrpidia tusciae (strain DSM 2912 / NBRC 15312 / T2) TaxID=562970 RepID=D5WQT8_KYRT2|nr:Creatininase [Kyrpidia tusciae DSM 2912]